MAAYFAKHAWGNTTLQDLVDELAAGQRPRPRRLARPAGWRPPAPTCSASSAPATPSSSSSPRRTPTRPGGRTRSTSAPTARPASGLERAAVARVEVTGPRTPLELPTDADLYLVNDDDLTFARTRPDAGLARRLLHPGRGPADGRLPRRRRRHRLGHAHQRRGPHGRGDRHADQRGAGGDLGVLPGALPGAGAQGGRALVARGRARRARPPRWPTSAASSDHLTVPAPGRAARARPHGRAGGGTPARGRGGRRRRRRPPVAAARAPGPAGRRRRRGRRTPPGRADPDPESWVRALVVRAGRPSAEDKDAIWTAITADRSVPISSVGRVTTAFWAAESGGAAAPRTPSSTSSCCRP